MGEKHAALHRRCETVELVRQPDGTIAFVVDFVGEEMGKLADNTPVAPQVSIGNNGEIVEQSVRYNPVTRLALNAAHSRERQ